MYKNKGLIFLVFILMLFLGCTQKKNTVAFETKGNPQELILGDSIFIETSGCKYLSFEDSLKNYSSNSKLLVAKYEVNNFANESRTLIRSLNLPDTVISINSDVYLNIPVRSVNDQFDVNELKLGKLNKEWNESKATWTTATDTTWENAGGDFTEINDFEMTHNNDTISVKIPQDLIIEWVDDVDNNFGLMIYTEQENFIAEFYSSEDIFSPRLVFDYTDENNEEVSFDKIISADTFISITDDQYEIFQNQIIFSNIQPIRTYINFKLEKSYFEGITDSLEFKRITINKAELCFIRKTDNEYFDEGTITIKPYLVIA
ncbi:MAG: DNRLRE domain-containing protein, partial [Candidatus Cloacimonetes bacterium]|nr:DNRLRE domain-containing protein [Candidatus Cloacimonadota bacterium]